MSNLVDDPNKPSPKRKLFTAVFLDALCLIGGVLMYVATENFIWLIVGAVIGSLILIPAILSLSSSKHTEGET